MVKTLYQCIKCDKIDSDKTQMEEHEKMDVTGSEFTPGSIYQIEPSEELLGEGFAQDGNFAIVIKSGKVRETDHKREYCFDLFDIKPTRKLQRSMNEFSGVELEAYADDLIGFVYLGSQISELSAADYETVVEGIKRWKKGLLDDDLDMDYEEVWKEVYGSLEFTKGIMPKQLEEELGDTQVDGI